MSSSEVRTPSGVAAPETTPSEEQGRASEPTCASSPHTRMLVSAARALQGELTNARAELDRRLRTIQTVHTMFPNSDRTIISHRIIERPDCIVMPASRPSVNWSQPLHGTSQANENTDNAAQTRTHSRVRHRRPNPIMRDREKDAMKNSWEVRTRLATNCYLLRERVIRQLCCPLYEPQWFDSVDMLQEKEMQLRYGPKPDPNVVNLKNVRLGPHRISEPRTAMPWERSSRRDDVLTLLGQTAHDFGTQLRESTPTASVRRVARVEPQTQLSAGASGLNAEGRHARNRSFHVDSSMNTGRRLCGDCVPVCEGCGEMKCLECPLCCESDTDVEDDDMSDDSYDYDSESSDDVDQEDEASETAPRRRVFFSMVNGSLQLRYEDDTATATTSNEANTTATITQ